MLKLLILTVLFASLAKADEQAAAAHIKEVIDKCESQLKISDPLLDMVERGIQNENPNADFFAILTEKLTETSGDQNILDQQKIRALELMAKLSRFDQRAGQRLAVIANQPVPNLLSVYAQSMFMPKN